MNDLNKIKIPFSLALLVALFTINPVLKEYGAIGFSILTASLQIKHAYIATILLLAASVYFFSLGIIGENKYSQYSKKIGNIVYALALVVPASFFLLWGATIALEVIAGMIKSVNLAKPLEWTLSFLMGALSSSATFFIKRRFDKVDLRIRADKLEAESVEILDRTKKLLNDGYYDLSIIESWKLFENIVNRISLATGKSRPRNNSELMKTIIDSKILHQSEIATINEVRDLRNKLVHSELSVTKTLAENVTSRLGRIIGRIKGIEEECYFCGKKYSFIDLEADDSTGASICKACSKVHPNWKDELLALGMDP